MPVGARCGVAVAGDRAAGPALAGCAREQERGDERERDDAADREPPHGLRAGGCLFGPEVGVGVERPDRRRGARRVVVVKRAVGLVVDVSFGPFRFEVVERTEQEVALRFDRVAVDAGHETSSSGCSRSVLHQRDVVGRRGEARRPAAAADRERDPARADHDREHRQAPRDHAQAAVRRRQQDVVAVRRHVRVADLGVVLSFADAARDVDLDRARLRGVAVGDRLTRAHRARELVREPGRARRRRIARSRTRHEHADRDQHDDGEREPGDPPFPQAQTPPDRTIWSHASSSWRVTGPRLPHAATPLGETT